MKRTHPLFLSSVFGVGLALAATGANAHTLDAAGGLAHPLMGLDHLLAMLAVGLWAAQLGRQAMWKVPLAFVAVMAVGFGLARLGFGLPLAEPMVVASVAVLGAVVAGAVRLPVGLGAALVSVFALFHGFAHGVEMPASGSPWVYAVGFAAATASLHLLGLALGQMVRRQPVVSRLGGAAIAVTGVALMVGL